MFKFSDVFIVNAMDHAPFSVLWARHRQSIESDEIAARESTDIVAIIKVKQLCSEILCLNPFFSIE
jgi:hypothetical protein